MALAKETPNNPSKVKEKKIRRTYRMVLELYRIKLTIIGTIMIIIINKVIKIRIQNQI